MPMQASIKIHCWGGFGSQLYALTTAIDLRKRFARRDVKLIFHTGGVTYREPEILSLLGGISYEVVEDFTSDTQAAYTPLFHIGGFKKIFVSLMVICGFLARADSDREFRNVKPWVRTLRGHYSYRSQSEATIRIMFSRLFDSELVKSEFVGIQYRLGDLTTLASKSPIEVERIADVFHRNFNEGQKVKIYSDSTSEAVFRLNSQRVQGVGVEADSFETIVDLSHAENFIGTSSKISFWVVILRSVLGNNSGIYMPIENRGQLLDNLSNRKFDAINFY